MRIRLYGSLERAVGSKVLDLDYESVELKELLSFLVKQYPKLGDHISLEEGKILLRGVTILINGRHAMFQGGLRAKIKKGDVVDLIPPIHGG